MGITLGREFQAKGTESAKALRQKLIMVVGGRGRCCTGVHLVCFYAEGEGEWEWLISMVSGEGGESVI